MSTRRVRAIVAARRARRQEAHQRNAESDETSTITQTLEASSDDLELIKALQAYPWTPYSISPRCAVALHVHCTRLEPATIVDFGCGASTISLAHYARKTGARIVSYDHEPRWLDATEGALQAAGVRRHVDLRLAPIVEMNACGLSGLGYELGGLPTEIDFVFIDGPPGTLGRRMTLPSVVDLLAESWTAAVHDAVRPGERADVAAWKSGLGRPFSFRISTVEDGRGVAWLTSQPS